MVKVCDALSKATEKHRTPISYHKTIDILKQFQKEVNDIRAERIAKKDSDPGSSYRGQGNAKEMASPCKVFQKQALQTYNNNLRTLFVKKLQETRLKITTTNGSNTDNQINQFGIKGPHDELQEPRNISSQDSCKQTGLNSALTTRDMGSI
ncbi:hypothetical protein Tco_1335239 [Tanacetum coccineum]